MKLHEKILWFVAETAFDVFLPAAAVPWTIGQRFYRNFLAFDPQAKLEFLSEGGQLSDAEINALIDALTAQWKPSLPGGRLSDLQRDLVRKLLLAPRAATGADPDEAIRQALNAMLLSGQPQQIAPVALQPEQRAVARSVMRSIVSGPRPLARPPFTPLPATPPTVAGYQLQCILGDGGFSTVYLARHDASGEQRAVKVGALDDPKRFEREVQLLQSLAGPHAVKYFEHGTSGGQFWIAMEYLGHRTLADLIAAKIDAETALLLGEQILRGLAALHEKGIVHRDLKPENVMVDDQFRLKLIDFGLAKPLLGGAAGRSVSVTAGLVGTPRYMSPEQIRDGRTVAPASDVWSVGCVVYELLTGQPLFASDNIMALGHEIMTKEFHLDQAEIPAEIRPILGRCLQRDMAQRIADAGAALREYQGIAAATRRRLRHERYRDRWVFVLDKQLLEKFAAHFKGKMPAHAPQEFQRFASGHGAAELDEIRIAEILPPIFEKQADVGRAEEFVQISRKRLQNDILSLSAEQIEERTQRLRQLEQSHKNAQQKLTEAVRRQLAAEVEAWGKLLDQEKARRDEKARQDEELRRQKQAEEDERNRLAEVERQRLERIRLEQEQARRKRKRKAVRLAAGATAGPLGGVVVLGGVGALIGLIGWTNIAIPIGGAILGAILGAVILAIIGAMISARNPRYDPCCGDSNPFRPVDPETVKKYAAAGAIIGVLGGVAWAINYLMAIPKGTYSEFTTGLGGYWGGLAGAAIGLVVGLIVAARGNSE